MLTKPVQSSFSLDQIAVRTPCTMDWELMTGDERTRFCDKCQKNVYNLSEMTRADAVTLIESSEKQICGRLFKRADGTIVTADCPVTKVSVPIWKRPFQFSIAALLVIMTASAGLAASAPWIGKKMQPIVQWFFPADDTLVNPSTPPPVMMVGDIDILEPPESMPPTSSDGRHLFEDGGS